MKYDKILLYMTILMITLFSAFASTEWVKQGDYGTVGFYSEYELYSSPYSQSNLDEFNSFNVTTNNDFLPIVNPPLDDTAGENLIYTFSADTINVYDTDGVLLYDKTFSSSITARPELINYQEDNDLEMIVPIGTMLYLIELNDGVFTIVKNFTIPSGIYNIETYYPFENDYIIGTDQNQDYLYLIKLSTGGYSIININGDDTLLHDPFDSRIVFSQNIFIDDLNEDGYKELYIAYNDDTYTKTVIDRYDLSTLTLTKRVNVSDIQTVGTNPKLDIELYPVNIGSKQSQKEIIIRYNHFEDDALSSKRTGIYVFDKNMNIVFTEYYETATGTRNKPVYTSFSVGDVNLDGLNEFCFVKENNFYCYDSNYNMIINITSPSIQLNRSIIAEYDTINNYMEIITGTGIYEINTTSIVSTLKTLSGNHLSWIYPVTLESRSSYIKDLLIVDEDKLQIYKANVDIAVCGNGICELGETELSCYDDCKQTTLGDINIFNITINPNPYSTWKLNTNVKVSFHVETSDDAFVQARAVLYYNDGNEQSFDWQIKQMSGTLFTFDFIANKTIENGILKLYGRSYNSTLYVQETYLFNVAENGIEFDDSILYDKTNENFDYDPNSATSTKSADDNSISNSINTLGNLTGLSGTILWLIIMAIVTFGVISYGSKLGDGLITSIVVINAVMLIIGTLLGFINPAIIIAVVVITGFVLVMRTKSTVTQ